MSSLREGGIDVTFSHSSKTYFSFDTGDAINETGVSGVVGGPAGRAASTVINNSNIETEDLGANFWLESTDTRSKRFKKINELRSKVNTQSEINSGGQPPVN